MFMILLLFLSAYYISKLNYDSQFEQWATTHNKSYDNDQFEFVIRRNIWIQNMKFIEEHNKANLGYTLAMNSFGDISWKEFLNLKMGYQSKTPVKTTIDSSRKNNFDYEKPSHVDWRDRGAVTQVKNQFSCGSCYSFSTTGAIEALHAIQTGNLVSLSEENIIDCSFAYGDFGCSGGDMVASFQYIIANGGIDTSESYPQESFYGWQCLAPEMCPCRFNKSTIGAKISGYKTIQSGNESALEIAIAEVGPISVAIDATEAFQFYQSGVFSDTNCDSTYLNHAVLAVGYGTTEDGVEYYIIKNSWGSDWGEAGYIRMARNQNNMCGISSEASYPY